MVWPLSESVKAKQLLKKMIRSMEQRAEWGDSPNPETGMRDMRYRRKEPLV